MSTGTTVFSGGALPGALATRAAARGETVSAPVRRFGVGWTCVRLVG